MTLKGKRFTATQLLCLSLYYAFAIYLPRSGRLFNVGGWSRRFLCRRIFRRCGKQVNIERGARFGRGTGIEIGDYSGIGIDAVIPGDTVIGSYVMMAPRCHILGENHHFERTDTPMMFQGDAERRPTVIGDDVWIGQEVLMTPGRHIARGTIIGARCVLTKDFPPYSIVGGNPSRLIRSRLPDNVVSSSSSSSSSPSS